MSNALSIAATTLTLRSLLHDISTADYSALPVDARPVNQIEITTLAPDQVRAENGRSRLNLFLYNTEYSAAWRNMDLPRQVRSGERAPSALALSLQYLITVYAENNNELIGHVLLGSAMRILHDHPVLGREEIRSALAASELDAQLERVRITAQPLTRDDMSKLWSGFQSSYRLSAAYEVGVLLIQSQRELRASLPVLRRGSSDQGAFLTTPPPSLLRVGEIFDPALPTRPRHGKPAAELGDAIVLRGLHFDGNEMVASLLHDRQTEPRILSLAEERDDTTLRVALPQASAPDVPRNWPAGFYTVELRVQRPALPAWTTNRVSFALAPRITSLSPPSLSAAGQPLDLTITCTPQILATQRAALLLGDRSFTPSAITTPVAAGADSTLVVRVNGLGSGEHVARLRVDGVDSLPIDFTSSLPEFDPAQTVTVTA
jgi:hypothetical protein